MLLPTLSRIERNELCRVQRPASRRYLVEGMK
jgi:hypothetical protein